MSDEPAYLRVKFGVDVQYDEPHNGSPRDFYDRDQDKRKALNLLHSPETRRAIWLVGERRAGKTSMLRLLLNKCRSREDFITFEVPWQIIDSPVSFYREFLYRLVTSIQNGSEVGPFSDADTQDGQAFWNAFQVRRQELSDKTLIVGIDEFDGILLRCQDEHSMQEIYSTVYRLIEEAGVKVILATVAPPDKIDYMKASPLVARSDQITLVPFEDSDITDLVKDYAPSCSESDLQHIRHLSGNWPYYTKALLYHLLQIDEKNSRRLEVARINAVKAIDGVCRNLYRSQWSDEERQALLILSKKKGTLQHEELDRLDPVLRTAFRQLVERSYLVEMGGQYRFRVPLIGEWCESWIDREVEEYKLGIDDILKRMEGVPEPWRRDSGDISIRITRDELRRRGF